PPARPRAPPPPPTRRSPDRHGRRPLGSGGRSAPRDRPRPQRDRPREQPPAAQEGRVPRARRPRHRAQEGRSQEGPQGVAVLEALDRKSTRLNSSHVKSSYAV